jgi:hypothetical protein
MHAWKRLLAVAAVIGLAGLAATAHTGQQTVKTYTLFNGWQTPDSTAQASYRIPIRGANRVVIRMFDGNTASWNSTDSTTTDSVTAWSTLFGDSVTMIAKDSLGTVATFSTSGATPGYLNSWNRNGNLEFNTYPITKDSTTISGDGVDSTKFVAVYHTIGTSGASNRNLSFASTKGGWYTFVLPLSIGTNPTTQSWGRFGSQEQQATFIPSYMWVSYTPFTRSTFSAVGVAVGNRTKGLKNFKAVAYVYYPNMP